MRIGPVVMAAGLALAAPLPAGAQIAGSSEGSATDPVQVITAPVWDQPPVAAFPEAGLREGVNGRAVAECIVLPTGVLTDCRVVEERPVDLGFGQAALDAASRARLLTDLTPGFAPNARVRVVVNFVLG